MPISQLSIPGPLIAVGPLLPKYPTGGTVKQAVLNYKKPFWRMLPESWPLRPSQTRFGSGVIKAFPVWFGAANCIGWPLENVVIAVRVHPPTAISAHLGKLPPKRYPRPKGCAVHTTLPTARWRTSNVAGPFCTGAAIRYLIVGRNSDLKGIGDGLGQRIFKSPIHAVCRPMFVGGDQRLIDELPPLARRAERHIADRFYAAEQAGGGCGIAKDH